MLHQSLHELKIFPIFLLRIWWLADTNQRSLTLLMKYYSSGKCVNFEKIEFERFDGVFCFEWEIKPILGTRFHLFILSEKQLYLLTYDRDTCFSRFMHAEFKFPESKSPLTSSEVPAIGITNVFFLDVMPSFSIDYYLFKNNQLRKLIAYILK